MPTATITSTENTFGTISGTFASNQSTITGTISGIITGTLEGSIGVPGPQGIQGPTGPAGEGVVAGGTTGQVLSKIDATDYNTQWSDPVVFDGGNITGPITMENETDRSVTSAYGYSCENLNNNQQNLSLNYAALYIQSYPSAMQVTATAITFPDSTTQSTSATNLGYITDAPADGPIYGRVNNSWTPVYAFTGGPITSPITLTDGSMVTGFESGSFYVNRTDGYSAALQLNSLSLSSDTQSIGIAAAGITFADATFQSTAANPFDGGDITGPITMHNGSSDSEMSASVFGVELTSDTTQNASLSYTGLNVQITGSALSVTATGITFPDASTQTVAFPGFTGYAPLESPAFTGTPTAPTATLGDDSTQIATTAFVQDAVISGSAHAETLQATVRNNTGSTLASFTVVYISGAVGNKAAVAKAQANSEATSSGTFAVTESSIANNADGIVISAGVLSNVDTSAFTDGDKLYLSPTVAGGVTTTKPSAPNHLVYVGVVTRSHPTQGTVSVRIANGFELGEIHDVAIASVADKDLLTYESSTTLWKNKSFGTLGLATLSSPTFTGVPAAPTASVGTNSTQLATTAFVTAAVPAFATNAQAQTGTSTTTAVTPGSLRWAEMNPRRWQIPRAGFASSTSGTGAIVYAGSITTYMDAGSTSTGRASVRNYGAGQVDQTFNLYDNSVTGAPSFSNPLWISGKSGMYNMTDANLTCRVTFGKFDGTGVGDLSMKGVGWKFTGGSSTPLILQVHNGTTLSNVNSSFTPVTNGAFNWNIYSDGAGNVTLYINGSSVATSANGPTGAASGTAVIYQEEIAFSGTPALGYNNRLISTRGAIIFGA